MPWIAQHLQVAEVRDQRVWICLITRAARWQEPDHLRAILKVRSNNPLLAKTFPLLATLTALYFPSLFGLYMNLRLKKWQGKQDTPRPPRLKPSPSKRIGKRLKEIESGNSAAWWRLNMEMTLEPNSTHYGDELESDLTVLPGWKAADAETRTRIVEAAKKYVLEQDSEPGKWVGKSILLSSRTSRLQSITAAIARVT